MAGENKLSRSLDGTDLLTYSYNKIKTSNVEQFIVVSSKENQPQASLLSHPYPNIVLQKEKKQGIGDNIALGVSHIKKNKLIYAGTGLLAITSLIVLIF